MATSTWYDVDDTGYYLYEVNASGVEVPVNGKSLIPELQAKLREGKHTDVVILGHGYITSRDENDKSLPFANVLVHALHKDRPSDVKPLYIAVHWPSALDTIFDEVDPQAEDATAVSMQAAPDQDQRSFAAVDATLHRGGIMEGLKKLASESQDPLAPEVQERFKQAIMATSSRLAADTDGPSGADSLLDPEVASRDLFAAKAPSSLDDRLAELEKKIKAEPRLIGMGDPEDVGFDEQESDPLALNVSTPDRFVKRKGLLFLTQDVIFGQFRRRASVVGSRGVYSLIDELKKASRENVRYHLIGHSLGGHVVSAGSIGPPRNRPPSRRVHTVFILQGAMENDIFAKGRAYRAIVDYKPVAGTIAYTTSQKDRALSGFDLFYKTPVGIGGVTGQEPFEKHSSDIGEEENVGMQVFDFKKESFHELNGKYVITGTFFKDAHGDIHDPETMRAFWSAARVNVD